MTDKPPVCLEHGPMTFAKTYSRSGGKVENYWYCSSTGMSNHTIAARSEEEARMTDMHGEVCASCGKPATRYCPATNAVQCGAPLCDNCRHDGSIISFRHVPKVPDMNKSNVDITSKVVGVLESLGVDVSVNRSPFLVDRRYTCFSKIDRLGSVSCDNYVETAKSLLPSFVDGRKVTHVLKVSAIFGIGSGVLIMVEWSNKHDCRKPASAIWTHWGGKSMAQDGHDFYPEGPPGFGKDVTVAMEFVDEEQRPFRICYTDEQVESNARRNRGVFCPYFPVLAASAHPGSEPELTPYEDQTYREETDIQDGAVSFDLDDWWELAFSGTITPEDGVGYFGTSTGYSPQHPVFVAKNFQPTWASKVVWFNK